MAELMYRSSSRTAVLGGGRVVALDYDQDHRTASWVLTEMNDVTVCVLDCETIDLRGPDALDRLVTQLLRHVPEANFPDLGIRLGDGRWHVIGPQKWTITDLESARATMKPPTYLREFVMSPLVPNVQGVVFDEAALRRALDDDHGGGMLVAGRVPALESTIDLRDWLSEIPGIRAFPVAGGAVRCWEFDASRGAFRGVGDDGIAWISIDAIPGLLRGEVDASHLGVGGDADGFVALVRHCFLDDLREHWPGLWGLRRWPEPVEGDGHWFLRQRGDGTTHFEVSLPSGHVVAYYEYGAVRDMLCGERGSGSDACLVRRAFLGPFDLREAWPTIPGLRSVPHARWELVDASVPIYRLRGTAMQVTAHVVERVAGVRDGDVDPGLRNRVLEDFLVPPAPGFEEPRRRTHYWAPDDGAGI